MVPLKRRKMVPSAAGNTGTGSRFPQFVLFLMERKMGASRRAFLSQLGRKKGFQVEEKFSDSVTHVVSESNSGNEVRTWLDSQVGGQGQTPVQVLDISWYTESMCAGGPVPILDRHKLQQQINEAEVVAFSVPSYACQRRIALDHHNTVLADALSLLAENAELSDEDGRGVAFRRAAAVLKALPRQVTSMAQLKGLPCLGGHSLRVIKDVLDNGASDEVESTKRSERYKALKVLTGIFGVGAKTAARWISEGIHTLQQLQASGHTLNRAQQAGLEHYDDLNQPVTKAEADAIGEIVEKAVVSVLPGAQVTLTGGFRRGKLAGHDVDFLITHPEEGREEGLMPKVVSWLVKQGFLLYQKTTRNSYLESKDDPQSAVRVDLVVSPVSQFAFALLGWTGSKLFERELRRWAGYEKAMSLSSHALYDNNQGRYLRAASEEEIFAHLGLEYIPPSERNA
uniref:DNA-directed DNA/RNA polymerase mu n=1 Tax=Mastacembelus armatus TaxID=205130 RepID=A0A7N9AR98_9TELE